MGILFMHNQGMKIRFMSDLHLEFYPYIPTNIESDVVILAGDIHSGNEGVKWATQNFATPVLYVPGNHEFYGTSLSEGLQAMRDSAQNTNVQILNNESIIINGVRFIGSTLWTDYRLTGNQPLAEIEAMKTISDFKFIKNSENESILPSDIVAQFNESKKYLQNELNTPFDGKTVVITHHGPSDLSIAEKYKQKQGHLSASYASSLDRLMGDSVNLWIHGHTHESLDYDMYGTRVMCNPRGYGPNKLNSSFNEGAFDL